MNRTISAYQDGDGGGESVCQEDIEAAKAAGMAGECTQQSSLMQCPHADVTYMARNGCEIGELRDRGWSRSTGPPSGVPGVPDFVEDLTPEQAAVGGLAVGGAAAYGFVKFL